MKEVSMSDIGLLANDYKIFGFSLALIFFCSAIIFCWRRAGSLYFFWDRLWFIVGGRKEFNNDKLNKIWEDVRDVELFRYRSGFTNVYSTLTIEKIGNWLIQNKIEFSEIIRVNIFFDEKNIQFKKHNYVFRGKLCAIGVGVFCLLFLISAMLLSDKNLLLNVVKTGADFVYDGNRVLVHWDYLDEKACKEKYYITDDLDEILDQDKKRFNKIIACQVFDRGDEYYKTKIKEQRKIFLVLALMFLFFIFYFFRKYDALNLAETIHVRVFECSSAKNNKFG